MLFLHWTNKANRAHTLRRCKTVVLTAMMLNTTWAIWLMMPMTTKKLKSYLAN